MIKNERNIRLWKACLPIRNAVNWTGNILPIFMTEEDINVFASKHPTDYLRRLQHIFQFLVAQRYFRLDDQGRIRIVGDTIIDGKITLLEITCEPTDEGLRVIETSGEISQGEWLSIKKQERVIRRNRQLAKE